ncbi:hypothetical protein RRF57_011201 [Xylaria bambusicola]|uniref:Arrestin-like N-terminal domain-containing protein n=1 Tax=Xylaria bambusicola TaxID=326684 RepID=A0AAN7V2E0_9PEZI
MGSNLDNATTTLSPDESPSKSSFFSRLAAPLRSRSRNLADFHIRLKEPHRQYSAGDHVQGSVVLSVVKPIRVTHLTVTLHGYVRAFKSASAAAQSSHTTPLLCRTVVGMVVTTEMDMHLFFKMRSSCAAKEDYRPLGGSLNLTFSSPRI